MMNRRAALAGAAALGVMAVAEKVSAQPLARNVVLVHGLFADGSSWSEVIPRLQAAGLNVTSVQNPLTTLQEAVAATQKAIALQDGPTVLAGHSFFRDDRDSGWRGSQGFGAGLRGGPGA